MKKGLVLSLCFLMLKTSTPLFGGAGLDPVFYERLPFWPAVENMLGLVTLADEGNQPVTYQVTFEATWSVTSHPDAYPANAHFSRIIGGVHNGLVAFWQAGELASDGIEAMAELGAADPLSTEIEAAISAGTAGELLIGPPIDSPGNTSFTFQLDRQFPRITLVTMVAPSPDWFIGVAGHLLFQGNQWLDESVVTLYAYDSGTDSGVTFTSPNQNTSPPELIMQMTTPFLVDGTLVPLGTFRFELIP